METNLPDDGRRDSVLSSLADSVATGVAVGVIPAPVAFLPELSAVGLVGASVASLPELATARMAGASVGTATVRESVAPGSVSGALLSEPQAITRSNIVYATHILQAKTKFVIGHFSGVNSVLSNPGAAASTSQ